MFEAVFWMDSTKQYKLLLDNKRIMEMFSTYENRPIFVLYKNFELAPLQEEGDFLSLDINPGDYVEVQLTLSGSESLNNAFKDFLSSYNNDYNSASNYLKQHLSSLPWHINYEIEYLRLPELFSLKAFLDSIQLLEVLDA